MQFKFLKSVFETAMSNVINPFLSKTPSVRFVIPQLVKDNSIAFGSRKILFEKNTNMALTDLQQTFYLQWC